MSVLSGAKVFSSFDPRQAYHQVNLLPSDRPKTTFKTPFGLYEYQCLAFGLTNAPAAFQSVMNQIFRPYLNQFLAVYVDDILVFSNDATEHEKHITLVLDVLRKHKPTVAMHKCSLNRDHLMYPGHVVLAHGVSVNPAKTRAVAEYPRPGDVHQLRSFLGMCNYFRKFVRGHAQMVKPLTDMMKKGVNFAATWDQSANDAFGNIKKALTTTPVLRLPDWRSEKPFHLYCDASYNGVGGVLLQQGQLVAFESKHLIAAELNYPCLLYTSPSPRDGLLSRMPSSA